jgi:hypothetical protein
MTKSARINLHEPKSIQISIQTIAIAGTRVHVLVEKTQVEVKLLDFPTHTTICLSYTQSLHHGCQRLKGSHVLPSSCLPNTKLTCQKKKNTNLTTTYVEY